MKHILTILTFLVWSYTTLASDTTIVFRQVKYADLFDLAKKENKGVMLYFHFDGCGACVKMEKTAFVDKKVVSFFNSNFVCLEVNTRKGEGIETNKIYNIQLHPTFLILDENGNTLHKIVGEFSPDEFVLQGQNALNPTQTLVYLKQQYKAGKRDSDFLFEYCFRLRDANELDSLVINEYLNTQNLNDLNKEKNIKFLYEFIIHKGKAYIPFQSKGYLFMLNNKNLFTPYFDLEQVNTRLMFATQFEVYNSIKKQDTTAFWLALNVLKEFDLGNEYNYKEMDNRITMWTTSKSLVLSAKITFYEKIGNKDSYNLYLNKYIETIWYDADELNNFAWGFYKQAQDTETKKIKTAIKCSRRSIELKNNYANNDTYAWLLYKSGEKKKVLKQVKKTIVIAKENNQDYSETQKLIDLIANKK